MHYVPGFEVLYGEQIRIEVVLHFTASCLDLADSMVLELYTLVVKSFGTLTHFFVHFFHILK